jgi:predicted nuclease of predicted toxin-antitoxin system
LNNSHIFLADENIPLSVIKQLRKEGCKIISVTEEFKSLSDKKILELSSENKWIIITFDRDFGDLIFKQNYGKPFGIIFLRIIPKSPNYILQFLKWLLMQTSISFEGNFVVVNTDKVRTIKIDDIR